VGWTGGDAEGNFLGAFCPADNAWDHRAPLVLIDKTDLQKVHLRYISFDPSTQVRRCTVVLPSADLPVLTITLVPF
jgi:hypothetical protein